MQENDNRSNYLSVRRKHFLWGALALVMFGAILYCASVASDYAEKNDIENFDDVKDNIVGVLKKLIYEMCLIGVFFNNASPDSFH